MNFKLVLRIAGKVLLVEAACLVLSMLVALFYREDPLPFVWSILILLAVGGLLSRLPASDHFFAREGFLPWA